MKMNRREFMKANAAMAAAGVAGLALPATASNLITSSEHTKLDWNKAPCRFCGTGCSVMVATREGRVVATHGDANSEVNRGLNCIKGYFLSKIMYGHDRLQTPMLRMTVNLPPSVGIRPLTLWPRSGSTPSRPKGRRRWACLVQVSGRFGKVMPLPS